MMRVDVRKRLGTGKGALELRAEFRAAAGEILALYGPSGAGKTTTLRLIAGLLRPDAGRIDMGETCFYDGRRGLHLPPGKRRIGFVFQDHALFPNLSVRQNLAYAAPADAPLIDELLTRFRLTELRDAHPATLSGGEAQRVALARSLVQGPDVLLLDEPFSALDDELRSGIQTWLRQYVRERGLVTILITHAPDQVLDLADQLVVLREGQVTYRGQASGYLTKPTWILATFLGTGDRAPLIRLRIGQSELLVPFPTDKKRPAIGQDIRVQLTEDGIIFGD